MKILLLLLSFCFNSFATTENISIQIFSGHEMSCSEIKPFQNYLLKMKRLRVQNKEITHLEAQKFEADILQEFGEYIDQCDELKK